MRYEIEMVAGLVWRMRRQRLLFRAGNFENSPLQDELVDHAGRNADIESFGIHARVLTDFLYRGRGRGQSSDAIASDFFDDPADWKRLRGKMPPELRTVNDRVGREMVHLSYDRSDPSKPWDYQAIWRALSEVLRKFVDHASPERAGEEFLSRVRDVLDSPIHEALVLRPAPPALSATTAPPVHLGVEPSAGTATAGVNLPLPGSN